MSKISLTPNALGTSTFTIASPNSNTDRTLTLPDETGTIALTSDIPTGGADVQTFNSNGTWTKPASGSMALIQVWSGGGGGARNTGATATVMGGGGGGYFEIIVPLSSLSATESVTIGAGGAGRTRSAGNGTAGGASSLGSILSVTGGGGGVTTATLSSQTVEGGGKQTFLKSIISDNAIGGTLIVNVSPNFFNGGSNRSLQGGNPGNTTSYVDNSVYGGGSGGLVSGATVFNGGTSAFAGAGGNASTSATGANGAAPSGGGGAGGNDQNGGNGAAGRVIVTAW